MLTEEERNHIILEETVRHEIKQKLKEGTVQSKWHKVWLFINSTLFIWFLSTIVIGIFSFIYTQLDRKKQDERKAIEQEQIIDRENRITARKLDTEIANRIGYFINIIDFDAEGSLDIDFLRKALLAIEHPSTSSYPINVFSEYTDRGLRSLLFELSLVVPESEKKDILEAYEESRFLHSLYFSAYKLSDPEQWKPRYRSVYDPKKGMDELMLTQKILSLLNTLNLNRWGNTFSEKLKEEILRMKLNAWNDSVRKRFSGK